MTQLFRKRLINIKEYQKMEEVGILSHLDKVELINGEILHMSPIGIKHQGVINKINNFFFPLYSKKAVIHIQGPIQFKNLNQPVPDVMLLKPRKDFYTKKSALPKDVFLLIEVADSSLKYDKEIKLPLYAAAKIKEYWIVNLQDDIIEIYRNPKNGIYKNNIIASIGDKISCSAFPNKKIAVKDILG